jgi:hypothetical protein
MTKDGENKEIIKDKKTDHKIISLLQKEDEEDPIEIYLENLEKNPWTRYYRAFVITEARKWLQKRLELEPSSYSQNKTFIRFTLVVDITISAS